MIPAEFRRVLDLCDPDRDPGTNPTIHISCREVEPWLTCWTTEAIDDMDGKIESMDDGDPDRLGLEEHFYENMEKSRLDDAGRLILPKRLREHAGITDEAIFASRGRTFRIYSPEVPTEAVSILEQRMALRPEGASVLSLLPSRKPAGPE
ncbi:MAG: hypothetical protein WBA25_04385 [Jannaschia sp.]